MIQESQAISGQQLIDLIPQKPPFVLVGDLKRVSASGCTTSFTIPSDHVLCVGGVLQASSLIENMAQTCAAKQGFEYTRAGKPLPIGFIGDVKDFRCRKLPLAGDTIVTEIVIENQVFDVTIISGRVLLDGEEIASCKMKVFVEEVK